ncbi:hypothetical protein [Frondihabitans sp. PAMC 28766]|uniref:hypothetical protein n=1 Tax=Frondihabitans sp. PAMC 28766 TaxID=1795630 RepID=UPI0012FFA6A9|nr:hypothetical protein [Frondihabitans sp. PAMC 28766]
MGQTFMVLFAGATVIVIAGAIAIFAAIIWRSIRSAQPKRPTTLSTPTACASPG